MQLALRNFTQTVIIPLHSCTVILFAHDKTKISLKTAATGIWLPPVYFSESQTPPSTESAAQQRRHNEKSAKQDSSARPALSRRREASHEDLLARLPQPIPTRRRVHFVLSKQKSICLLSPSTSREIVFSIEIRFQILIFNARVRFASDARSTRAVYNARAVYIILFYTSLWANGWVEGRLLRFYCAECESPMRECEHEVRTKFEGTPG